MPQAPGDTLGADVAVDGSGNAIAVWTQGETFYEGWGPPPPSDIWANRLSAGSGWGIPVLLDRGDRTNFPSPQVAIDAQGNAIAVWQYDPDGDERGVPAVIRASRFSVNTGWGPVSVIGSGAFDAN